MGIISRLSVLIPSRNVGKVRNTTRLIVCREMLSFRQVFILRGPDKKHRIFLQLHLTGRRNNNENFGETGPTKVEIVPPKELSLCNLSLHRQPFRHSIRFQVAQESPFKVRHVNIAPPPPPPPPPRTHFLDRICQLIALLSSSHTLTSLAYKSNLNLPPTFTELPTPLQQDLWNRCSI